MTKRVRKDRLSKWDDDNAAADYNPLADDHDDDISLRSSVPSADGYYRGPQDTQPPPGGDQGQYQDPYYNGEGPHTLRYFYNELPTDGVPAATVAKETKKEAKRRIKEERDARRGQGQLAAGPATEPSTEMNDNYFPYWYYYKAKNPDWIMRQQQYNGATDLPPIDPTKNIDPIDPENLPAEPKLTLAQRKARQFQYGGRDTPSMRYNHELRRYEMIGKDGKVVGVASGGKKTPGLNQFVPLKDGDDTNDENLRKNGRHSKTERNAKLDSEYDWAAHYAEYMRNKSALAPKPRDYRPNIRSRNRRGYGDYDPLTQVYGKDDPRNGNGDHTHDGNSHTTRNGNGGRGGNYNNGSTYYSRSNRYTSRSQQGYTNSNDPNAQMWYRHPGGRSNQNYSAPHGNQNVAHNHGHSHGHSHGHTHTQNTRHDVSSRDLVNNSFRVFDASRGNVYSQTTSGYSQPPPSVYNQGSLLPPLGRSDYFGMYPMTQYGTQAMTNDWKTLAYAPQMYKTNAQTKFYDRYLNNVIDKRLFT